MSRALLALVVATLAASSGASAAAQAPGETVVNTYTPPPSDFVAPASGLSRLELVAMDHANGLTDLAVFPTGANQLVCHLPCTLEVPPGMLHLVGNGLDQRFDLQLPAARFSVRAGEPIPWAESIGGLAAGIALGVVGGYAVATTSKTDEVVGGAALIVLGGALVVLVTVVLVLGALDQGGAVELESFEQALREGTLARF